MTLTIPGLAELRSRLERLRPDEIMATALADQAERLAQSVRDSLAEPPAPGPGATDHDKPWRRTGALQNSIESSAAGLEATVGSNDPAAAPQEMGTSRIPPRPFLAPAAASAGEGIAKAIGSTLADALKAETST